MGALGKFLIKVICENGEWGGSLAMSKMAI